MQKVKDVIVVIPSYNPDDKLVNLVEELVDYGFEKIVIVNDGSAPESLAYFEKVAKKKECTLLVHEINKGKGRALKTAFSYCEGVRECCGVITVDGDGQHLTKDIVACVEAMYHNKKKVILGVRDFSAQNVPLRSKFGNEITKKVFYILCGIRLSDTQTGLRGIPVEYLNQFISYQGERYEYETNMLLMMKKHSIEWEEVKISTVYLDNNAKSHFNTIKDSWRIYKTILAAKRKL